MTYTTKNILEHPLLKSDEVNEVFSEYLVMRKKKKNPATEYAIKLLLLTLVKLSGGKEDHAISIMNKAIVKGWLDFYELQDDEKPSAPTFNPGTHGHASNE